MTVRRNRLIIVSVTRMDDYALCGLCCAYDVGRLRNGPLPGPPRGESADTVGY